MGGKGRISLIITNQETTANMHNKKLQEMMVQLLKDYKETKEKEGYIPTLEMLIEELEQ